MEIPVARSTPHRRGRGAWGRPAALIVVGLVLLLVVAPRVPGALAATLRNDVAAAVRVPAATQFFVNVTATGYSPATLNVTPAVAFTIHLHNVDPNSAHTFSVYARPNVTIPHNDTPAELNALFAPANASLVNVSLAPGAFDNWTANLTQAGSYEFVSLIPYQFQAGFFGFLNVSSGLTNLYEVNTSAYDSLKFVPNLFTIPPNAHVIFHVTDEGTTHTFTVDSISNDTNITVGQALPTSSDPGLIHPLVNLALSSTGTTYNAGPVAMPAHAVYWFVCTIPGHFQAGMYGFLYVGASPSPPTTLPSESGFFQVGILAVGGIVLAAAALLILLGMSERARVSRPRSSSPPSIREGPPSPPEGGGH
jgi:hypothetical protein